MTVGEPEPTQRWEPGGTPPMLLREYTGQRDSKSTRPLAQRLSARLTSTEVAKLYDGPDSDIAFGPVLKQINRESLFLLHFRIPGEELGILLLPGRLALAPSRPCSRLLFP